MKFCEICNNMLYMKLGEADELVMYCKNCGFNTKPKNDATTASSKDVMCVFQSSIGDEQADYKQYMTKDVKYDRTLPRVRHIKCINSKCTSTDADREVIYIKYDQANLKFLYFCCTCETFWKTE
jgi:DNA-directed RNA polymerase subunit M/transcription elongation factor TFIIS